MEKEFHNMAMIIGNERAEAIRGPLRYYSSPTSYLISLCLILMPCAEHYCFMCLICIAFKHVTGQVSRKRTQHFGVGNQTSQKRGGRATTFKQTTTQCVTTCTNSHCHEHNFQSKCINRPMKHAIFRVGYSLLYSE